MRKALVVRPIADAAVQRLKEICDVKVLPGSPESPIASAAEIAAAIVDTEILLALPANPITAAVISAAPHLKLIASMGTGHDNIDLRAARARSIPVTYAPGILDETTADFAMTLLLATARRLPQAERFLRNGQFRGWSPSMFLGHDVFQKTLGIVGMGRIGRAVARRAQGFEMRILYTDVAPNPDAESATGAQFVAMPELLRSADFVSVHVPLSPATKHLIGAAELRLMRPTAYLINTSRGPVVDEAALTEALERGLIAGAGLDVFEREPEVHPRLLRLENAVLTPHIASASESTRLRMALRAVENIQCFLRNQPLLDPVPA